MRIASACAGNIGSVSWAKEKTEKNIERRRSAGIFNIDPPNENEEAGRI
jgi:hypothetical protein